MQSDLENRRGLQLLRESMQHTKAEKLELPLTAKLQQSANELSKETKLGRSEGKYYSH
jgi:hypothetical protein